MQCENSKCDAFNMRVGFGELSTSMAIFVCEKFGYYIDKSDFGTAMGAHVYMRLAVWVQPVGRSAL